MPKTGSYNTATQITREMAHTARQKVVCPMCEKPKKNDGQALCGDCQNEIYGA
mgnify:CR=1 FL=1